MSKGTQQKHQPNEEVETAYYSLSGEDTLRLLGGSRHGLPLEEVRARLGQYGPNALPRPQAPGLAVVFLHQFKSPLIYVLLAAALLSMLIQEWSDAVFIAAVLLVNALIGTIQEYSAQRAATALSNLVTMKARVLRKGETYVVDAEELVVGDLVLLESGDKVPADLRLLSCHDLSVDESLLTGESLPVSKQWEPVLTGVVGIGDRLNMLFSGTLIGSGRARAVVTQTGLRTELGQIAADVLFSGPTKAPLQVRMDKFTHKVAMLVGLAASIVFVVNLVRGMALGEIFMAAVALAVSVIPEGLPVALTVALAIGMGRMAKRHVIVRRLLAVEALGSCTFIATDKTGTLTVNQLTVRRLVFPDFEPFEVTGEGVVPEGVILTPRGTPSEAEELLLQRLCAAVVLANEAFLGRKNSAWVHSGDAVDTALLVMAHKIGITREEMVNSHPEIDTIPYESEHAFSASLNYCDGRHDAFVKGAVEKLLPMCEWMATREGDRPLDGALIERQALALADQGYRVLAAAAGETRVMESEIFGDEHLVRLTFLGLIGIIDPLRPEAKAAVAVCRRAGIEVAMVTGDHPSTALALAREIGLAEGPEQVVTGPRLQEAEEQGQIDQLTARARVFARVSPRQKLAIVASLQRNGHFVAVSGDGANDAPALRAAQVGVAMGKSGTDVARETAELIITDDNFASLVAGVEEGRVAYANVRKVIFLLISTGAAELVLFILALLSGLPLPLVAVQLLWLNLVTNGIQDVALAFEPAEGDELSHPPRPPREDIFNRIMVERVALSALVIGVLAFYIFQKLLAAGFTLAEARNETLLLMVLFENVHVFNSRSESRSLFRHSPLRNPFLLLGTLTAQLIHIGAMYTPVLSDVLQIRPVSFDQWLQLMGPALSVLLVMEMHKAGRAWWKKRKTVL